MRLLIHNQKGGVGKTTTAANLGAALLRSGQVPQVRLVDMDPQMHLTAMLAGAAGRADGTVADWLAGRQVSPVAIEGEPGLSLLPGCDRALPVPVRVPVDAPASAAGQQAGWTLIDSAPAWSDQTAMLAHWAQIILCPLEPDFLGLSGVSRLLMRFDDAGVPRSRLRFLLCRFMPRLSLHRDVMARLIERLGPDLVLPVTIRNSVRLSEAPGFGRSIFRHAPRSTGAADYMALAGCLGQARHMFDERAA